MAKNTDLLTVKSLVFSALMGLSPFIFASDLRCENSSQGLCQNALKPSLTRLKQQQLTATLVTDAPLRLLRDTQALWLARVKQCKTVRCYQQQIEARLDDLNIYTSLNQTMTQHYVKFEQGQIAKQAVHLKIHQLSKDSLKIEGWAYRSPNNRLERQVIPFLAYTTPQDKQQITDNEHDCRYEFRYSKALLVVSSQQIGCERFNGVYRLYD